MKKKNLFLKLSSTLMAVVFLAASSMLMTSCGDDDEGTDPEPVRENTILEIISESSTHTQLELFLNKYPDLISVLEGSGPLTVFAPNDAAFTSLQTILDVESLESINPDIIKSVLAFHVHTAGEIRRSEMETSTTIPTAQGENITFNASTGNIFTGGSNSDVQFVGDEILATNGVVHVTGTILVPPVQVFSAIQKHLGKVSQAVLLASNFSILAEAIAKADEYAAATEGVTPLADILSDESETLTVFAPVNGVFQQAGLTADSYTGQVWYSIIAHHVLSVEIRAADFEAGTSFTSKLGLPITVLSISAPTNPELGITTGIVLDSQGNQEPNGQVAVGDAFVSPDNGVVHAFAGVLEPPAQPE